ncbi:MAG: hypothetical protein EOO72_17130 [Myxococcaceae bacterium]|nr:MAG: hypothetical protein EOO72_17130 [Myxococcaceae bacterium]
MSTPVTSVTTRSGWLPMPSRPATRALLSSRSSIRVPSGSTMAPKYSGCPGVAASGNSKAASVWSVRQTPASIDGTYMFPTWRWVGDEGQPGAGRDSVSWVET